MSSDTIRIALIGMGRMGQELDALAEARQCHVVARIDVANGSAGLTQLALNGAQVAIDFTQPDAAVTNAIACLSFGVPVVIGTTGWQSRQHELEAAVVQYSCAALWSPNFSPGVQMLLGFVEDVGRRMRNVPGFDAHIVETHHTAKRDAPSGTGLALQSRAEAGFERAVPITSVRVGSVPGTHELIFDAPFEQIRLTHDARDRRVFADGALMAARWITGARRPAVYTMQDVFSL